MYQTLPIRMWRTGLRPVRFNRPGKLNADKPRDDRRPAQARVPISAPTRARRAW